MTKLAFGYAAMSVAFFACSGAFASVSEPTMVPRAPSFPAACIEAGAGEALSATLVVDVAADGHARNVRLETSDHPCLDEAAVAEMRAARFLIGDEGARADMPATLTFERDALREPAALSRTPPRYPRRCSKPSRRLDFVEVSYDVAADGRTENVEIVRSSDPCFEKAVRRSVGNWRYDAAALTREGVKASGIKAIVTLDIADRGANPKAHVETARAFDAAAAMLDNGKVAHASAALGALDAGAFNDAELGRFYRLRAEAAEKSGDRHRAFDDYRAATRFPLSGGEREAVLRALRALQSALDLGAATGPKILAAAPPFPAVCAGKAIRETAAMLVDFSIDGFARNPRIVEASDPCVRDAAIAHARGARHVGKGVERRDVRMAVAFDAGAPPDAKAVERKPAAYPSQCRTHAAAADDTLVRFDLSNLGRVENVRVLGSTNRCLDDAVARAVADWRFRPFLISDPKDRRKDVEALVSIVSVPNSSIEFVARRGVEEGLGDARKALKKGRASDALKTLAAIERHYGASFRRIELAGYYLMRGKARAAYGDEARAKDDLAAARQFGARVED
jgi:TonB family protein